MHRRSAVPRSRRLADARFLLVAVVVSLGPVVWSSGDLMLRASYALGCAAALVVVVRRRRRPGSPSETYTRALQESSALHVRLRHARVVAVRVGYRSTLVTVTWRAASTTLLDADGRARADVRFNALTDAYTMSIPVTDDRVAALLSGETELGSLAVYATTDLMAHPDGNLFDDGVVIDQYDLDFPSWSGSLPASGVLADRDV